MDICNETHLIDVTSQPLATAYLHILEPRNPFPPQTTSLLTEVAMMVFEMDKHYLAACRDDALGVNQA